MKWLRSFRKLAEVQALCPDTMLVSIGDRESDLYELFAEATGEPAGPKLLVRAERTRNRRVEQESLWQFISAKPIAGELKLQLPKRGNRRARQALLDVRFCEVELQPPKDSSLNPVRLWAVHLNEEQAEDGGEPIEWMLLTTVAVTTFEQAVERAEWYAARWGIEVFHRTLKSGCRIKDRQLGSAERLQACLGVDMVVAWRIYHLTMLGREMPEHPSTAFFEEVESATTTRPPSRLISRQAWPRPCVCSAPWVDTLAADATVRLAPRPFGVACNGSTPRYRCTYCSPNRPLPIAGVLTPTAICHPPTPPEHDGVKYV